MSVVGEGTVFEAVRVPDGDRDAWLDVRRQGVGGSDVAAIMGLSRWKGAYSLWAEKTGLMVPGDISDRPAVEWGNRLEPLVAEKYRDVHPDRTVRRVNAVLRSIKRPWAQASLDYEVRDPELGWGVLEIKTAGLRSSREWEDGVPVFYQTQVAHYLSVTGRAFADVAVLIGGSDWREYRIMRDEDDIRAVDSAVDRFWRMVEERTPPEVGWTYSDSRAVFELSGPHGDGYRSMDERMVAEWREAKEAADEADKRLKEAANRLKAAIGDARGMEGDSGRVVWSRGTRERFDTKRFKKDHLKEYEEYVTITESDYGLRFYGKKEAPDGSDS